METGSSHGNILLSRILGVSGILLSVLLCFSPIVSAQQPTATISALKGNVLVSIQGKESVTATVDTVLQAGDVIETKADAEVLLTLSDGSTLDLGENTKLDMSVLAQEPQSKARVSRLKLLWGKIRATLSPGHQKEGSSFDVETPNALVGVKFSKPDVEVIYDPETETTYIMLYTVEGIVTNLLTRETKRVPRGGRAIVRAESIISFLRRRTLLLRSQRSVGASVSASVPVSSGGSRPETSNNPSPGVRGGNPDAGYEPREVSINVDFGL